MHAKSDKDTDAEKARFEKKVQLVGAFVATTVMMGGVFFWILYGVAGFEINASVVMGAVTGFFMTFTIFLQERARNARAEIEAELKQSAEALKEKLEEDFFTNLVKINFKYLDQYYLQTQQQSNKSFMLSMWVSVVGFIVLLIGIGLMYRGEKAVNGLTPGYVTAAAGVIAEFIAAVFFYLYNKTVLKMSEYHQKLVITQNIALALKITGELPEKERAATQIELVKALMHDVNSLLAGQRPEPSK